MFLHPVVSKLLELKWDAYGKKIFIAVQLFFAAIMITYTGARALSLPTHALQAGTIISKWGSLSHDDAQWVACCGGPYAMPSC